MTDDRRDWGVPDWRQQGQYAHLDAKTTDRQWAWEFQRRNWTYRLGEPIDDPSQLIGWVFFEDPAKQFDPSDPAFGWTTRGPRIARPGETTTLGRSEAAIVIDLRAPAGPQVKEAMDYLSKINEATKWESAPAQRRSRKNYPNYLRILDAVDDGARDADIARVIYPGRAWDMRRRVGKEREAAELMRKSGFVRLV